MTDPFGDDVGVHYRTTRERIVTFVRGLSDVELATQVPACPGWTVQNVLGHIAGIPDDLANGRLKGIPDDAQTADQVARAATLSAEELLTRWELQAPDFQAVLTSVGVALAPAAIDLAAHEQDMRGALGQPGARYNATIAWALPMMVTSLGSRLRHAGLPALRVVVEGEVMAQGDADGVSLTISQFEAFRALLGRRSRNQVAAYEWSADPAAILDRFFVFGPAAQNISE